MAKEMYIEGSHVAPVVKALSSDARLKILSLLSDGDMNIQALASSLGLSKTATLTHINVLEQAGFITSKYRSGSAGNQRVCHKEYDRLVFDFDPQKSDADEETYYESEIPVGNYFGFDAWAPCGITTHNHIIHKWDDPSSFFSVDRVEAALVWTAFGYLEYRIPMDPLFIGKRITKIKIHMELAAHHMVKTHKALCLPPDISANQITDDITDVTFWVNGVEIGTQTVRVGDDREEAVYTPTWWRTLPYHGELVKLSLNDGGCFINKRKTCDLTATKILTAQERFFTLRLGIKPNAEHMNGIMLFGRDFGRYNHGLLVKFFIAD
jgi:predicted transcriptional regulator